MSEAEVYSAYLNWHKALSAMKMMGDKGGEILASGYVGALGMVLGLDGSEQDA